MTFNNGKSIINLKLIRRTSIVLFLAFLFLTYVVNFIKYPLLGMNETLWTLIVLIIFLLIFLVPIMLNYQYIYFSDDGENIIVRYYSTGIIEGNKNSVEINKMTFSGFTFDKKLFGLFQSITLYQRFKEGIAKYPPIYINALKREDKARIIKSLNSYVPAIKSKE